MNYKDALLNFDESYFHIFDEDFISGEDASYHLATYLHDSDFEVNKESWDLLQDIKNHFPALYELVLFNIFNRNHDT